MTMYRVVGECAHVTTDLQGRGMTRVLLYKGSILPADVRESEVRHLLSIRAIARLDGGAAPAPAEEPAAAGGDGGSGAPSGDGDPSADGDGPGAGDEPDSDETGDQHDDEPAPAAPGAKPTQNANKATWVEWAVSQGADRDEAEKSSKADLVEAYGK